MLTKYPVVCRQCGDTIYETCPTQYPNQPQKPIEKHPTECENCYQPIQPTRSAEKIDAIDL